MPLAFQKNVRIQIPVGDEHVVLICRKPSAEELSRFLNSRFESKGRKIKTQLYEARKALIDRILVDAENAQYEDAEGQIKDLNCRIPLTEADKTACAAVLGTTVDSWKDLIPMSWKSSAAQRLKVRAGGRSGKKLIERVREFLESDFAAREKECLECESTEREHSEDGYCSICKFRALEELYPWQFREWVANLTRLHLWRKAGYRIGENELDFDQWQALALISRHYEMKDLEAQMRARTRE